MASRTTVDGDAVAVASATGVVASGAAVGCFGGVQQLVSSRRHSLSPFVVSIWVVYVCVGRTEVMEVDDGGWWTC